MYPNQNYFPILPSYLSYYNFLSVLSAVLLPTNTDIRDVFASYKTNLYSVSSLPTLFYRM